MPKAIEPYQIVSEIDSGGMATVYKGIQPSLNRTVAIKILHQKFSQDSRFVKRFNRESLIIARLNHPNIIHIIDRGITEEGMPYFVMDFVEGRNAADIIRNGSLPLTQKMEVIVQVCKALSYAHRNGVVHQDIKPGNILLDQEGNVLVADFGIAHLFHDDMPENMQLTRENVIMGTPAYMSPEQNTGGRITHASDLYSLGVVMYELFTGAKPMGQFRNPTAMNPEIPPALDRLILQCLQPRVEDRPASADSIREELLGILQGAHIQGTRRDKAMQGVPKMEELFTFLDIIRETQYGTVYLFRHKGNNQLMVVKRYRLPMGGLQSAYVLKNLKHPHIVEVFGVSGHRSNYIIVMEYVGGGSLADRMLVPHPWPEALAIIRGVCEGLAFAHRNRIVHGNLRPSNILFTDSGEVKLTDFGLNEHYATDPDKTNWFNAGSHPQSIQADILAVGAILYKLITGRNPVLRDKSIESDTVLDTMPADVEQLVMRLLSQDPAARFPDVDQVIAIIKAIQPPLPSDFTQTILLDDDKAGLEKKRSLVAILKQARWIAVLLLLLVAVAMLAYFFVPLR